MQLSCKPLSHGSYKKLARESVGEINFINDTLFSEKLVVRISRFVNLVSSLIDFVL